MENDAAPPEGADEASEEARKSRLSKEMFRSFFGHASRAQAKEAEETREQRAHHDQFRKCALKMLVDFAKGFRSLKLGNDTEMARFQMAALADLIKEVNREPDLAPDDRGCLSKFLDILIHVSTLLIRQKEKENGGGAPKPTVPQAVPASADPVPRAAPPAAPLPTTEIPPPRVSSPNPMAVPLSTSIPIRATAASARIPTPSPTRIPPPRVPTPTDPIAAPTQPPVPTPAPAPTPTPTQPKRPVGRPPRATRAAPPAEPAAPPITIGTTDNPIDVSDDDDAGNAPAAPRIADARHTSRASGSRSLSRDRIIVASQSSSQPSQQLQGALVVRGNPPPVAATTVIDAVITIDDDEEQDTVADSQAEDGQGGAEEAVVDTVEADAAAPHPPPPDTIPPPLQQVKSERSTVAAQSTVATAPPSPDTVPLPPAQPTLIQVKSERSTVAAAAVDGSTVATESTVAAAVDGSTVAAESTVEGPEEKPRKRKRRELDNLRIDMVNVEPPIDENAALHTRNAASAQSTPAVPLRRHKNGTITEWASRRAPSVTDPGLAAVAADDKNKVQRSIDSPSVKRGRTTDGREDTASSSRIPAHVGRGGAAEWRCGGATCNRKFTSREDVYIHMTREHSIEGELVCKCLDCGMKDTFVAVVVHRKHCTDTTQGCATVAAPWCLAYWFEKRPEAVCRDAMFKDTRNMMLYCVAAECTRPGNDHMFDSFEEVERHHREEHNCTVSYKCNNRLCLKQYHRPHLFMQHMLPHCIHAIPVPFRHDVKKRSEGWRNEQD